MATAQSYSYSNIARPYALSAFDYARDKKDLSAWKAFLETAAEVAKHPMLQQFFIDPQVSPTQLYHLFEGILISLLNPERKNFLLLLAEHKRLIVLPAIADLFLSYHAALEKISKIRLITAVEVKEDLKQRLKQALARRIEQDVTLVCEVDPSIIAGAVIHLNGKVIDGSIRGKLTRLLEFSLR